MKYRAIRAGFVSIAVFAMLALVAAPAAAKTTVFRFDFDSTYTDNTCSFPVERREVGKGTGRSSPGRVDVKNAGVATLTNPENGVSATQKFQILFKNRNQVVNEDGTLTMDQTVVGPSTLYGPNGGVLLRDHGPIRVILTINPNAPTEEEFIVSQEVVFEHGSHADTETYCQILGNALGVAS